MTYIWDLNPVAFSFLGLDVRWYGLVYILGFFLSLKLGFKLLERQKKQSKTLQKINKESFENLLFGLFFSGLIGGRLGEFLFYSPSTFWTNSTEILKIWHGGMSIHGGIIGAALFGIFWSKKHNISFFLLADILVIPLTFTLFLGRIANFLNGELVGVPTENQNWGVIFPYVDDLFRHPSQLYESAKNLFLFILLSWLYWKNQWKKPGFIFIIFLGGYGILRFLIEFFREPDGMIGIFSTGQILCMAMILFSIILFLQKRKKWENIKI